MAGDRLGYANGTVSGPWVALDLALLWHVVPHFFVGIQPEVFHAFGTTSGGPNVGGQESWVSGGFLVGGWFGGPSGPGEVEAVAERRAAGHEPRFGAEGQVVLDSELVLDASWIGYERAPSQSTSGGVDVAMDDFLTDHVSVGAGAGLGLSNVTGIDSTTGATTTQQNVSANAFIRLGIDLPLAARLSLWPRASLGYSWLHINESEAGSIEESDKSVYVSLYAPLLVHPVSHFLVGFGPSIAHDLSHAATVSSSANGGVSGPEQQNRSTTVGCGLTVGGWL